MPLQFDIDIDAEPVVIFALLSGLGDYDDWLPRSSAFHGTVEISSGPVGVGTSYREPGPMGVRNGRITAYEPPRRIDFEQPMTMRPAFMGTIGIVLTHQLTPIDGGTRVSRTLALSPKGPVRLLMPLIVPAFRAENHRILACLKRAAEERAAR